MLDEKDLQAIAQLMDMKLEKQKKEIIDEVDMKLNKQKKEIIGEVDTRLNKQKKEIISEVDVMTDNKMRESEKRMMVMMESYFDPKFNALSERLDTIERKLVPMEAVDILDDRMDDAEQMIKLHTHQISELKKAQ